MADFRKWLFAFAVLALMLGAFTVNAQVVIPPGPSSIVCQLNPANPTIVSVENISALVGDYVLVCSGGTPTPSNTQIPQFNVTLTLNQNVTSRLFGGALAGYIDVLLAIDEPYPTPTPWPNTPSAPPQVQGSPTGQKVCYSVTGNGSLSVPVNCNVFNGTFANGNFSGNPYNQVGASNVFVAHATSNPGQVTWLGVPIDAPGTAGQRIIRMTNIRANACAAGLSGGLVPTQINGFVSFNGSQNVVVNNNQQTLAFVQQGLLTSNTTANLTQCVGLNVGAGSIGGNFPGGKSGVPVFAVKLTEGYAASFKRKTAAFLGGSGGGVITDVNDANNTSPNPQNVPGFNYNTESGFQPPQPAGGSGTAFGAASQGDRFLLVFNNVGTGVNLWVPQYVTLTVGSAPGSPNIPNGGAVGKIWQGGWLQLVGSSSDLSGNITGIAPTPTATFSADTTLQFFTSTPFIGTGTTDASGNPLAPFNAAVQLTGSGNVFTAVYEVVNADPFAPESANIPIGVSFVSNTGQNLPAPGQSTVTASMAPLSTVNVATSGDPIPRWCNKSSAGNSFKINVCTCDLLFPFVTNIGGFDTGIAIANTSLDPYGTSPQNGNITLNFYGSLPGTPAPAPITPQTTTSAVNAGTELLFTLSSGGTNGIQAEVGFTGYIIAVANFQWCHGFAFISDLGAQKLAEGYLAIQLDIPGLNRVPTIGENKAH